MDRRRIVGKIKEFDNVLHNHFDVPAREKIKEVLGDMVIDNPDEYGADMIITHKPCNYKYLELQICNQWTDDEKFPYPMVYIYARKALYGPDTIFLVMNRKMTVGYFFDIAEIADWKPRRFKKWSREWVFDIPWEKTRKVYIDNLDELTMSWL